MIRLFYPKFLFLVFVFVLKVSADRKFFWSFVVRRIIRESILKNSMNRVNFSPTMKEAHKKAVRKLGYYQAVHHWNPPIKGGRALSF